MAELRRELSVFKHVAGVNTHSSLDIILQRKFGAVQLRDVEEVLQKVSAVFAGEELAKPCCEVCQKPEGQYMAIMPSGNVQYACQACQKTLEEQIQHRKTQELYSSNNYLAGLIGAVLCSLGGVALWIVLSLAGFIAGIAGLAIGACAYWGYKKFGGKVTKFAAVMIIALTLVMIVVANYLSLSIAIFQFLNTEFPGEYIFIDAVINGVVFLQDPELMRVFLIDLIIGIGLTALASYREAKNLFATDEGSVRMHTLP